MKLPKVKITRLDDDGETEIIRSNLNVGLLSFKIKNKIDSLIKFVKVAQKGERTLNIQIQKFIKRYSSINDTENQNEKQEYYIYLQAIEYAIYELNRMVEIYHHEFLAHINDDIRINLSKSLKFDFCKNRFKKNGIYISKINGYESVNELRKICNDLKHSYIQEYSLSKTLNLRSFREFNRKILVDKVNVYLKDIPKYIKYLAREINEKYPKIEVKIK